MKNIVYLIIPSTKLAFLTIAAFIFSTDTTCGQWVRSDAGVAGGNVKSLAVSGGNVFAGLQAFESGLNASGVFISSNGGASWAPVNNTINTGLVNASNINCFLVNGSNLFAGTWSGGVFLSTDNGATWTAVNNGLTNLFVNSLAAIGANIFAGTQAGVFLSADNGATWTAVNSGITTNVINSLFAFGTHLYAGTGTGVFLSTNNGTSWTSVSSGPIVSQIVYSFAAIGTNLFAGSTNGGLFMSADNGSTWTTASTGLPSFKVAALFANGTTLFAGTEGGGAYISTNNGASWTATNTGLGNRTVNAFALNGTNLLAATPSGVFSSANSGASWILNSTGINTLFRSAVTSGSNTFVAVNGGVFVSSNNGASWADASAGLTNNDVFALTPSGPTLFAGTAQGFFLSADNGASWTLSGLTNFSVTALAVNGSNIYAGTNGSGVYHSNNNGASWTLISPTLNVSSMITAGTDLLVGTTTGIKFYNGSTWDSRNSGLTSTDITSIISSGTKLFVSTRGGGVFVSTDNGLSWTPRSSGIGNLSVYSIVLSGTTLFAGAGNGVLASTDEGLNWATVNTGLPALSTTTKVALCGPNLLAGAIAAGLWSRPLSQFIPAISSFSPSSGPVGTPVTITGTNFSTTPASNEVRFNGTLATVTASTTTSITTTVPVGATTGKVSVSVDFLTTTSASDFTVIIPAPTITVFTPTSGVVGTTVTITGTNFSTTPANNAITFNGTAATVTASTATSITTTVPPGASNGKISVTANSQTATSTSDFTVVIPPPAITSFAPASGVVGTTVIITGTNFSTTPSNNSVSFNGTAATVTASTATSITTTVPPGAASGKISVTANSLTATSTLDFTVTVPPDTSTPVISNNTGSTVTQENPVNIAAVFSDPESGIASATLLYRPISEGGNFTSIAMTKGAEQEYVQTIPAGVTGALGVEYKFDVTNGVGLKNDEVLYTIRVAIPGSGVVIPYASPGSDIANYKIIAIPLDLNANSVGSVFNELGAEDHSRWRMFHYQNGTNQELNLSTPIAPGKGYWLITRQDPGEINSGAGVTVAASTQSPFQINLTAGWNQIGNPYTFNIDWTDVQAANNGLPGLRKYEGDFFDASVLNKMEGGFINVPSARTITIPVTRKNSVNGGRISENASPSNHSDDDKNWQVYLQLTQGDRKNRIAGFGMHKSASEAYDIYDGLNMPRFFGRWLEINHVKNFSNVSYSKDIVPISESHIWEFSVETSDNRSAMTFTWDTTRFQNNDGELYLWDNARQLSINMHTTNHYSFSRDQSESFKIIYGSVDFVKKETVVTGFELHDAWPNPVCKGEELTIAFSVPESAGTPITTISIYDLMGREVWAHKKTLAGGYHEIQWKITEEHKQGVYVLTVKSGDALRQVRIAIR